MRTYSHLIDTKAVKLTLNSIPDHWVIRDLSERDYGIDLMVEIFTASTLDENGHQLYDATGRVCYLQIKGTNSKLKLHRDKLTLSFNVEKKALLYVEKFATPFILVRAYTLEDKKQIYYVWLQRYIQEILDVQNPDWRKSRQEKFAVRIPVTNSLPENTEKIQRIAARIKYVEEFAEFYEKYMLMKPGFEMLATKGLSEKQYQSFMTDLKRIKNLTTLWEYNHCQLRVEDIEVLITFIKEVHNGIRSISSLKDFPDPIMFNLELLEGDNFGRMSLEQMIAEVEETTVY